MKRNFISKRHLVLLIGLLIAGGLILAEKFPWKNLKTDLASSTPSVTAFNCGEVINASSNNAAGNSPGNLNYGISLWYGVGSVTPYSNLGPTGNEMATLSDSNVFEQRYKSTTPAVFAVGAADDIGLQTLTVTCDTGAISVYTPALSNVETNMRLYVAQDGSTYHTRADHNYSVWPNGPDLTPTQALIPDHLAKASPAYQPNCYNLMQTTYAEWTCEGTTTKKRLKTSTGKNYNSGTSKCDLTWTDSIWESEQCASGTACNNGACITTNYGALLSVNPATLTIEKGATGTAVFTITNLASVTDSFTLDIPDGSNPGCTYSNTTVSLAANASSTITVTCNTQEVVAGNYSILLRTKSAGANAYNSIPFSINVTSTNNATDSSLIGYWKFDGNGQNEITGKPNAVNVGNVVFNSSGGKFGGYVYLSTGADYLRVPYNSSYDLPDTFTIEFWLRQRSNQSFFQDLVYKGSGQNNYNFRIFRQLWNQYNFGPIITGYTATDTGWWTQTSNPNELAHNVWHNVVFTKSLTGRAYYLDGILTHSATDSPRAQTPHTDIIIGDSAIDTDIDNLKIYNRALTAEEVLQNSGFPSPIPPFNNQNNGSGSSGLSGSSGTSGVGTGTSGIGTGTSGVNSGTSGISTGTAGMNSGISGVGTGTTGYNSNVNNTQNTNNNYQQQAVTKEQEQKKNSNIDKKEELVGTGQSGLKEEQKTSEHATSDKDKEEEQEEAEQEDQNDDEIDDNKEQDKKVEEIMTKMEKVTSKNEQLLKDMSALMKESTAKYVEAMNQMATILQDVEKKWQQMYLQTEVAILNATKALEEISSRLALKNEKVKNDLSNLESKIMNYHFVGDTGDMVVKELNNFNESLEGLSEQEIAMKVKAFSAATDNYIQQAKEEKYEKGMIPFKDADDGDWWKSYTADLKKKGVVKGFYDAENKPLGEYRPSNTMILGEILAAAIRNANLPLGDPKKAEEYGYKGEDNWILPYFVTAKEKGLTVVDGVKNFADLSRPIDRGEVVMTYLQAIGEMPASPVNPSFPDIALSPAKGYIEKAKELGMVQGHPDGYFRPDEMINRAEFSAIAFKAGN